MAKLNHLTRFNKTIYVHGFETITNDAYVTIHPDKRLVVISAGQAPSESRRKFTVRINGDRTIHNEHLYQLLDEYNLFDKRFAHHSIINTYFPTDMAI